MASTLKPVYAASSALTWTSAATLANGSASGCAAVDNTVNLYDDALVSILATIAAGAVASDKLINVWFASSEDGSTWPGTNGASDNYGGTDAAVSLQNPTVYRAPFVQATPAGGLQTKIIIPSVLKFLGGLVMPRKWGLIIENRTGLAFTALSASYTGANLQSV